MDLIYGLLFIVVLIFIFLVISALSSPVKCPRCGCRFHTQVDEEHYHCLWCDYDFYLDRYI